MGKHTAYEGALARRRSGAREVASMDAIAWLEQCLGVDVTTEERNGEATRRESLVSISLMMHACF